MDGALPGAFNVLYRRLAASTRLTVFGKHSAAYSRFRVWLWTLILVVFTNNTVLEWSYWLLFSLRFPLVSQPLRLIEFRHTCDASLRVMIL